MNTLSFNYFSNLSVSKKISLGTGVILLLLVAITSISYIGLSTATDDFTTYRKYARETNQYGRIQANLLSGRLGAKDYIIQNTQQAAQIVETRIQAVSKLISESEELITRPESDAILKTAVREIETYRNSFNKVTELVLRRNKLVQQLNTVGPTLEKNLDKVMKSAYGDSDVEASFLAGQALRHVMLARLYVNKFLVDNASASAERAIVEIKNFDVTSAKLLSELQNFESKKLATAVVSDQKTYSFAFEEVVSIITARNDIIKNSMDVIGPKIAAQMEQLKLLNKDLQDDLGPKATENINNSLFLSGVISVFAIIFGLAIAFFTSRAIANPISGMTAAMTRLASGDKTVDIPATQRTDEVGQMAQAVLSFKEAAQEKEVLEARTAEQDKLSQIEKAKREANEAEIAANTKYAVESMAQGLQKFSDGDLTVEIREAFEGDLDILRVDFNISVAKIKEAFEKILESTKSIDSKTIEIRDSSDSLSKRTESQAASLEETSAALEQITATVGETSSQSKEAAGLAIEAKKDTDKSSEVVTSAVTAMERIEAASSEIAQIINVIDEIAFQTNLLALNAGVEAARAGEAGSGFAVVAQEVRELAQRSAEAAKEIGELITKSNNEVVNGVKLVKATGDSLQLIANHVTDMNSKLSSISAAAAEQLTGVREVNIAVSDMDQVTQQNAAMVEESTAVTFELASDVQTLSQMVGQFKINSTNATSSEPTKSTKTLPRLISTSELSKSRKNNNKSVSLTPPLDGNVAVAAISDNDWQDF